MTFYYNSGINPSLWGRKTEPSDLHKPLLMPVLHHLESSTENETNNTQTGSRHWLLRGRMHRNISSVNFYI